MWCLLFGECHTSQAPAQPEYWQHPRAVPPGVTADSHSSRASCCLCGSTVAVLIIFMFHAASPAGPLEAAPDACKRFPCCRAFYDQERAEKREVPLAELEDSRVDVCLYFIPPHRLRQVSLVQQSLAGCRHQTRLMAPGSPLHAWSGWPVVCEHFYLAVRISLYVAFRHLTQLNCSTAHHPVKSV
jgi:hypothetical protein